MANFSYTVADLTKAIAHSLAGQPDVNLDAVELVNDSLSYLSKLQPWRWKETALNLDSANGVTSITLPTDFESLQTMQLVTPGGKILKPCSMDQLLLMRAQAASLTDSVYYCVTNAKQASQTVSGAWKIELYPTPTSTTAGAPYYIVGQYLRQPAKLTATNQVPDCPDNFMPLLKMLCRAMAITQEEQQRGNDWNTFQDMLPSYQRLDGELPGYLGRMRSGLSVASRQQSLAARTQSIGT